MYYELYIDVLFLVNFMMDYILLLLVRKMLASTATYGRICLGAIMGAILTCIVVIIPTPHTLIKFVVLHVLVNTCMIRVGLKIRDITSFIKAIFMLYIGGFLLGGLLTSVSQYVKVGSLFFALAVSGYYVVLAIWKFISWVLRWNQYHCTVELHFKGEKYRIKGLIDTGNALCDPISGQPVNILDRKAAKKLFGEKPMGDVRYIPYQTIGKNSGILPAFHIDKMCVYRDVEYWITSPLIGISEEKVSARGEYDMILNPNLF